MISSLSPSLANDDIAAIRRFNRFHTRMVGALNERLLASEFSLPQMRILYEIANAAPGETPSASALAQSLRVDPGYLSRLVSGLEADGFIERTPTAANGKRLALGLTEAGRDAFARLDAASVGEVEALIEPLSSIERRQLTGAMQRIRRLLGDAPSDTTFILRDPNPGDLAWVVHRQTRLYAEDYGWDWTFEALAARIVAEFVEGFLPKKERCWIAEREGEIVGSVFVVRQDDDVAKLRMLYVEASARGLGLGRRLVDECLRFAKAGGYRRMELWTNDILISARRIYQAAGFKLLEEAPHHSFGKDLIGQVWARDL